MSQPVTPRRTVRQPLSLAAQCRTITGIRDEGYLSDISAEGCCITTRGILFLVGSRVMIKPKGMEGLSGVVRWIEGHRAGVQFDTPLYAPIVDHLANLYAAGSAVSVSHRQ
jgi:hypothetical protein